MENAAKENIWDNPDQDYTSAATSINSKRVPKTFRTLGKKGIFTRNHVNLDIGGGKFDTANHFLEENYGAQNFVYDPFNRSEDHNENVIALCGNGQSDTVTIFNVLNVIKEDEVIIDVLKKAHDALKLGGHVFVSVWDGNKSGIGKETRKGYQRNQLIDDYVDFVYEVFGQYYWINSNIIGARKWGQNETR